MEGDDAAADEFVEDGPRLPPKPRVDRPKGIRISEADLTPAERAYANAAFPHRKKKLEGDMKYGQTHATARELGARAMKRDPGV